jgi:hypothetical protein
MSYTVFQTANTCLNISISTCPIATYISLDANSGIHVARVSNQSASSSDGALWLDTFDNKCFTFGIKWYVRGNRACAGIQCIQKVLNNLIFSLLRKCDINLMWQFAQFGKQEIADKNMHIHCTMHKLI